MYAVRVPSLNALFFVTARPRGNGLEIRDEVEIDIPPTYSGTVNAQEAKADCRQILCQSNENPNVYKIFKDENDIPGSGFKRTDEEFGGVFSGASWERFRLQLEADLPTFLVEGEDDLPQTSSAESNIGEA